MMMMMNARLFMYNFENLLNVPILIPRLIDEMSNILLEWRPQSPDLSPIENIWNVLKMKMKALTRSHARMREACRISG
jgi:hypothetical protein